MATRKPPKSPKPAKQVEALTHSDAKRKNIPTAEYQSVVEKEHQTPIQISYDRRNRDLDPQLVWRGKDEQDWSDLVVQAPPLYIQEKVHPKVLIDDLLRETKATTHQPQASLFADFNGLPTGVDKTEFYQHDANWTNRMILGDSLQVMASLAEREGLRGKVQCIYFDPPYGIKFNSNFQWSTTSRDVRDGSADHITREPEQVKAFRDTWRDGIHSYLTYLRDRLTTARDLLSESGSVFVQIGDENAHRVRLLMDEVFGDQNFISQIAFRKTTGKGSQHLDSTYDVLLWYGRSSERLKYRPQYEERVTEEDQNAPYLDLADGTRRQQSPSEVAGTAALPSGARIFRANPITNQRPPQGEDLREMVVEGKRFTPGAGTFRTDSTGMRRLAGARRLIGVGNTLRFVRYGDDFPFRPINNIWDDTRQSGFAEPKVYVVQTVRRVIERCVLLCTDPGDLVLDPTCGSGTTAYVAEQWGRRWITIDTSRVALALARARIMGARYPFFLLADSRDGQMKEGEITRTAPSSQPVRGEIRHGFVYERVPHITLKSIANNTEIDVIWEQWQKSLEPLREAFNGAVKKKWEEWEIPREPDMEWPEAAKKLLADWWQARIARQKEIDASIAAKAESEHLYDKPYEDKKKVRVAGPFTVESLSPHRVLGVDENDELIDNIADGHTGYEAKRDFPTMILENLRVAGVQQADKASRITFTALTPWPGEYICADGRYLEGKGEEKSEERRVKSEKKQGESDSFHSSPFTLHPSTPIHPSAERRAAIFIGPEFGTVSRPDLVAAAREAADADFDVLIACAFNYEAHATEFAKLGRIPVLKARMNADLHMAEDLKSTGKGNLFVIFGEPDIEILPTADGQVQVKVKGVDVFDPRTGEVRSDGPDGIACWFIDTDYNEESFFVRHAYFLGQNDPYKSLKTTLKAEINEEAWASLNSDTSRPFPKPESGRIAVKVINHLGDEVMKVFRL